MDARETMAARVITKGRNERKENKQKPKPKRENEEEGRTYQT